MRWLFLVVAVSGMITGCSQSRRYGSVEEVCALGNYQGCTLVETIGKGTAPFKHSSCMVVNKGVGKFMRYLQRGVSVKRDLNKYNEQEVWLVCLTDDHNNSLVLVMVPKSQ